MNDYTITIGSYIPETRTMKTSDILDQGNADPAYVDLVVHIIDTGPYREYKFTVTLNKEDGSIFDGCVGYADSPHASFVEADSVPDDIRAAFLAVRPQMVAQLETVK